MTETMASRQLHSHLANALVIAILTMNALETWPASNEMALRLFRDVQGLEPSLRTTVIKPLEPVCSLMSEMKMSQFVHFHLESARATATLTPTVQQVFVVGKMTRLFLDALEPR
jgi:hypothetical protein